VDDEEPLVAELRRSMCQICVLHHEEVEEAEEEEEEEAEEAEEEEERKQSRTTRVHCGVITVLAANPSSGYNVSTLYS